MITIHLNPQEVGKLGTEQSIAEEISLAVIDRLPMLPLHNLHFRSLQLRVHVYVVDYKSVLFGTVTVSARQHDSKAVSPPLILH